MIFFSQLLLQNHRENVFCNGSIRFGMSEPIVTVTWWNAMPYAKEGKYFNFWEAKITERKSFTKSRTPTKLDFPSARAISLNPILIHYLNHATAFFSVILLWVSFSNLDLCPRCIAFCLESRYSLFPASVCLICHTYPVVTAAIKQIHLKPSILM